MHWVSHRIVFTSAVTADVPFCFFFCARHNEGPWQPPSVSLPVLLHFTGGEKAGSALQAKSMPPSA